MSETGAFCLRQVTRVIIRLISSVPDLDKNPFEHPFQINVVVAVQLKSTRKMWCTVKMKFNTKRLFSEADDFYSTKFNLVNPKKTSWSGRPRLVFFFFANTPNELVHSVSFKLKASQKVTKDEEVTLSYKAKEDCKVTNCSSIFHK